MDHNFLTFLIFAVCDRFGIRRTKDVKELIQELWRGGYLTKKEKERVKKIFGVGYDDI